MPDDLRGFHSVLDDFDDEIVDDVEVDKAPFGMWNAGATTEDMPPPLREWILGNTFCRSFLSSLVAEGGTGKSALRMAQAISVAANRQLTHERVFKQTRVLYISLEDDARELRRRFRAALRYHKIRYAQVCDRLWLASPGDDWQARSPISSYTLAYADRRGDVKIGEFLTKLENAIYTYKFGLVIIDPFVKLHAVNENSNAEIDFICRVLASIAMQHNVAIDVPHHTSKLSEASPISRSNRARGGSAFRDAVRLLYTLSPMTEDEAAELNIPERERRFLVRVDPGKLNITVPADKAIWYRLVGERLDNGNDERAGDEVQTVARWEPPDVWKDIVTVPVAIEILNALGDGLPDERRYTIGKTDDEAVHAWRVVKKYAPDLSETQAKRVLEQWKDQHMIESRQYKHKSFRNAKMGLYVLRMPG